MKYILLSVLFFSLNIYASDKVNLNDKVKIEVMQNDIEHLQKQIDDYKNHQKEINDFQKDEIDRIMQQKEDALDSRMLIYVSFFVAAFIIVFGFFRWLGKSEIRRIVNEQASKQIDELLKIKLADNVIDEKLTSLGKPLIETMLTEISASNKKAKESADELEKSSERYKKLLSELSHNAINQDPAESSPEEIAKVKEFNEVLDIVKDENEFSQKDWYLRGKEAFDERNDEKAIDSFSKSISIKKSDDITFDALYYRGLAYFRNKQFGKATKDFTSAININPRHYAYLARGLSYLETGQLEKALKDTNKALAISPDYEHASETKEKILKIKQNGNQSEAD